MAGFVRFMGQSRCYHISEKRSERCENRMTHSKYGEIYALFRETPPDWEAVEQCLLRSSFTPKELAEIAYELSFDCIGETMGGQGKMTQLHGPYLPQSLQLLLDHGMDPNGLSADNDDNMLWNLQYVDAPDAGAASMRLLLENGADPNHVCTGDPETLFESVDACVTIDMHYDMLLPSAVQCWMVLMAYGGKLKNGREPLELLNGFDTHCFIHFEDYRYELVYPPESRSQEPDLLIYDRISGEMVARL